MSFKTVKKINKKILVMVLITLMIFIHYVSFADSVILSFRREDGESLSNVANVVSEGDYLDNSYTEYSAKSKRSSVIHVYDYETTNEKQCTNNNEAIVFDGNENKYFLTTTSYGTGFSDGDQQIYYSVVFEANKIYNNVATFLYEDAIRYKGKDYNVKLNLKQVKTKIENDDGTDKVPFRVMLGSRQKNDDNKYNLSSYSMPIEPMIQIFNYSATENSDKISILDKEAKMEVQIEYYIVNDNGQEVNVSGAFGITDIDLNQGVAIEDFEILEDEIISTVRLADTVKYKGYGNIDLLHGINSRGVYVYSSTYEDFDSDAYNAYFLLNDKSKINTVFTFDTKEAGSSIKFIDLNDLGIKTYKKITTEVVGGTITPSVDGIREGENCTIYFAPDNNKYLKSITIDGIEQVITGNESEYVFRNITANHSIKVVYDNIYTVTYDAKGGNPTPDTEKVKAGNTATEPTTNPTKEGYTFMGWEKQGETSLYDFETPVNSDITLEAIWTPNRYTITYVLDGGVNDSSNTNGYKTGDVIDFKNPTKPGYTFKGWYEDGSFTTNKPGILSTDTGNKIVYAKWEANSNIPYKVEHYKQNSLGQYDLAETENLTGVTDTTVTATPKEYEGYEENTTYVERISSGTVNAEGTLVLKLYYDIIRYTVTYDAKGGTPTPVSEIVIKGETATEPTTNPTKPGYEFRGWRKNDEPTTYNFNAPVNSDITLEAVWTPIKYKINYVLNGGTNNNENPAEYTVEDQITFKPAVKEGYDFLGWYEDENFTTRKDDIVYETGDKTVYAKWKAKEDTAYMVEHYKEVDNGQYELVDTENLTGTTDATVTAIPKSYTGYTENTTHEDRINLGTIKPDGSLVLKLFYDKIVYKVTFEPNNGKTIDDENVEYNKTATEPTEPTKPGYTFEGWYYKGEDVKYDFEKPVVKDVDLEAKWTIADYTITYILDGGVNDKNNPTTYTIEDVIKFKEPTKEGYIFKGWYEDKELKIAKNGITNESGDKTVYAKWEKIKTENNTGKDNTVAKTTIPQTGESTILLRTLIIALSMITFVFGIRYFKIRNK